ncbi:Bug family tripartite tricarboxylate transporter substrate binding protein [Poseidonibacter antarcticus]|uniref:Bug family tripartite tricarboxylate transporter substrate binding protein n=1 Tax=Poseidonibacter antarcticus TaxID=2478538 RepID=UPI000EF49AD0|nr:tripartite tricarboxylate transporter substrate-binding protein [Poseidonibacter antarcticus]
MKIAKRLLISTLAIGMLTSIVSAKEVSFKGKTIEWIMPYKAGGGTDKWGRFYAPLLSQNLPGNPVVVIKNMPGGGSTKGANFFAKRASKDGLTIFASSASTQIPFLLGDKRVRYQYKDWNAVLSSPTNGIIYVSSKLGVNSIDDLDKLKSEKLKFGSQGATSMDLVPLLAFHLLNIKTQPVFGMKGKKSTRLAFLRGETNIDFQSSSSYLKNVLPAQKEGRAVPLFAFGTLDENGDLQRDPTFPNLPHFGEVYEKVHGKKPSGEAYKAWKTLFTASFPSQKMIMLPKGVSQDVIETYQNAMKKIVATEGFKEMSRIQLGDYKQTVGAKADKLKDIATSVNDEDRQWIRHWLTKNYRVRF